MFPIFQVGPKSRPPEIFWIARMREKPTNTFLPDIFLGLFFIFLFHINRTASSEFGTYRLYEQRRFRRACASAQSRQNLRCSPIQAVNQEEPSNRKTDPWPIWMAGYAQLKFVITECSKTQIRLTGPNQFSFVFFLVFFFPDYSLFFNSSFFSN